MPFRMEAEHLKDTDTFCIAVIWATMMILMFFALTAGDDIQERADRSYCDTIGLDISFITRPDGERHMICRGPDGRTHGS